MPKVVKCGLIQASHACATSEPLDTIREANIAKHIPLIEQAAREGVQILCMQEIFTGPYFCAEQTTRWYDSVEGIPDGPTTKLMQELAKLHNMVMCSQWSPASSMLPRHPVDRSPIRIYLTASIPTPGS